MKMSIKKVFYSTDNAEHNLADTDIKEEEVRIFLIGMLFLQIVL